MMIRKFRKKMTLRRRKSSAIAHNISYPITVQETIYSLHKCIFCSVSNDASNHDAIKMYP